MTGNRVLGGLWAILFVLALACVALVVHGDRLVGRPFDGGIVFLR